jgi:hypothetical protein
MAGLRDNYQFPITLSNLYQIRLNVQSGMGEALKPMITTVGTGATVTVYGAQETPAALTDMALIKDDVAIEAFEALPNYIAVVQKSGTSTSTVVSSINLEEDLGAIS